MGPGAVTATVLRQEDLKAIVFDLDGTLYQDERLGEEVNLGACRYVASLRGISPDDADTLLQETRDKQSGTGKTLSRAVLALGGNLPELHQWLSREVHPEGVLQVDHRVTDLLERLGKRFELHLYTNNNRQLSARIMSEIGVTGLFRKIFTIEDYWRPKPDQESLTWILQAIGRKPVETLFVGDRYGVDLAMPEAMGCPVFEARTVEELLGLAELVK